MKTVLSSIFVVVFLASCGNSKEKNLTKDTEIEKNETQLAIIKEKPKTIPNVSINEMKIEDGILFLNVSYSGGCENQTFELLGSDMIMKSMPPKRELTLVRDDKGDNCREWVTDDLKFDLKPVMLDGDKSKQIIFVITNNQQEIALINESM
jgi:hypothetical protein